MSAYYSGIQLGSINNEEYFCFFVVGCYRGVGTDGRAANQHEGFDQLRQGCNIHSRWIILGFQVACVN